MKKNGSTNKQKIINRQKKALDLVLENGGNVSKAMKDAGYSDAYSKNPQKLKGTKAWAALVEENLPDVDLASKHKTLLNSFKLEHMVFPTDLDDEDIEEMIRSVNCTVKKLKHGREATHCWYWAPDNKSQQDALELAYKVKGKLAPDQLIVKGKYSQLSDEELAARIKKAKNFLLKK